MLSREQIQIKTPEQVRLMRRAGLVVADIHAALRQAAAPGVTTGELDAVAEDYMASKGVRKGDAGSYCTLGRAEIAANSVRPSSPSFPEAATTSTTGDSGGMYQTIGRVRYSGCSGRASFQSTAIL